VQADEIKVKTQMVVVWMALAIMECARVDDLQGRARSTCRPKTARSQA
jgi:hypothetical protein